MKKSYIAAMLVPFLVCALILFKVQNQVTTAAVEPLLVAMEATGAKANDFTVNGWSQLPLQKGSEPNLTMLVETVMTGFDFGKENYKIMANESKSHRSVRADAVRDNMGFTAIAQIIYPQGKDPEVYLVVNMEALIDKQSLHAWEEKIAKIITDAQGTPRISTCLVGWIDDKLDNGQLRSRLHKAFSAIKAGVNDTVTDANFVSMSGYSDSIADSLTVAGKQINVNMAMRYSPSDNRTYVIIGSPVITREY